jgi:DNA transformation protein
VYQGRDKTIAMSYWRIPERLLDDPEEMAVWARAALAVARRAAAARKPKAKRGPIRAAGAKRRTRN